MMITLLLAALSALEPASAAGSPGAADPVRLWINSNRSFKPGEPVKVQVETERSGYLLVLHLDPDGRLSVLFPLYPGDDALVQAGRRYEIRDERGSESFVAAGPGPGLVYSALAEDPWLLEGVRTANGWDYGRLSISKDSRNPEADITAVIEPLASERGYDYDVLDYLVTGGGSGYVPASYVYDDGWGCYSCGYWGPSAIYIGLGWPYGYAGWPWWYSRFGYSRFGYSRYGYPWYWGYPYNHYFPIHVPIHRGPFKRVIGRPRGYTIQTVNPFGTRGRRGEVSGGTRSGTGGTAVEPRDGSRRARGGRPSGGGDATGGAARPSDGGSRASGERPQSSRPRGESNGRARGGRNDARIQTVRPQMEPERPASRARGDGWIRDGNAPEAARTGARRIESSPPVYMERSRGARRGQVDGIDRVERIGPSRPVRIETPRSEPGARRVERPTESRSQGARSMVRPRDNGSSYRPSEPRRSSQPTARSEPRSSPRVNSAPSQRSNGGTRAKSHSSRGGNGGGRSRGGRP